MRIFSKGLPHMSEVIRADNLYKTYHSEAVSIHAVNGISLSLEDEIFYSIIGRSGSGKSTLLNLLSGLDTPDSGTVLFRGRNLAGMNEEEKAIFRRRHMGFVFQRYNLLNDYTILTNILMPLKLDAKEPDLAFLHEICTRLGIGSQQLKRYPSELSGGQQQRAAIARSLIAKPDTVFADEPTGNLDKETGKETMEILMKCAKEYHQTLVVVTHDPLIAGMADKVFSVEDGMIVNQPD